MKGKRGITIRVGPLGLSLLAAGITAVGVAAVSLADSGGGSGGSGSGDSAGNGSGTRTFQMPIPPGGAGGAAGAVVMGANLSSEDRQKLEDFRNCMEENGAPGPPDPSKIDPSDGPPKPPSAADREKMRKAFEACKSKLPERLRNSAAPRFHTFRCGPPPGAPPPQGNDEQGQKQDQSNQSGTQSSGSSA
jgi:hypothetical protein